jgi:hypothetical protein
MLKKSRSSLLCRDSAVLDIIKTIAIHLRGRKITGPAKDA